MSIQIIETQTLSDISMQEDLGKVESILCEEGFEVEGLKHIILFNIREICPYMIQYEISTYLRDCGIRCPMMTTTSKIDRLKRLEEMLGICFLYLSQEGPYTIITPDGKSGDIVEAVNSLGYKVDMLKPTETQDSDENI